MLDDNIVTNSKMKRFNMRWIWQRSNKTKIVPSDVNQDPAKSKVNALSSSITCLDINGALCCKSRISTIPRQLSSKKSLPCAF